MKRVLSLLTALALILALPLTVFAEAVQAPDEQTVFEEAARRLLGVNYEKLAPAEIHDFLNGTVTYTFLCRITPVLVEAESRLGLLTAAWAPDSGVTVLDVQTLPKTDGEGVPALPGADDLRSVFGEIAALDEGTAGASLKRAGCVCSVWVLCARFAFDRLDAQAVAEITAGAAERLTEAERAACAENAQAVLGEALRLCDASETLGGEYADAGAAEIIEALRADSGVCASVMAWAAMAMK
ncbi:MAG: hypothetical protein IKS31_10505 [Clostridia bacterium]|nr:hypothetical protein [Clostridia bacterium]